MIFLILGTRSEVIKLSSLIRELIKRKITFKTIHTGQHDTLNLMKSLELPEPDYYLGKSLRKQWSKSRIAPILALIWGASVFLKLRKIFQRDKPGIILYNGNTMAVPLACFAARSILFYKPLLVHRESGLRANSIRGGWLDPLRKTGEYFGNILFTPSKQALISLKNQYNNKKIVYTGDAKFEII
ncbi:MAG: UDP-N-acetylglucosamine 2-epimerase, partial [Candidatus Woesearchaeota archaeon]|nr:UDP-N-acetylglucosamine 2-epimerase [Candidatus Woesearchaeota archaeon]